MLRIVLVGLLTLLAFPIVQAAPPGPGGGDCTVYPGCHDVYVTEDANGVCAGYVYPYRGHLGACVDNDEGVCVLIGFEFTFRRHCTGPLA